MAKQIQATGTYKRKADNSDVEYTFEYDVFDSFEDAVDTLGEAEVLKLCQRMTKLDANNTAREKAKVANGDSERKVMSEEEKAEAKAKRSAQRLALADPEVLALLARKGIKV